MHQLIAGIGLEAGQRFVGRWPEPIPLVPSNRGLLLRHHRSAIGLLCASLAFVSIDFRTLVGIDLADVLYLGRIFRRRAF